MLYYTIHEDGLNTLKMAVDMLEMTTGSTVAWRNFGDEVILLDRRLSMTSVKDRTLV